MHDRGEADFFISLPDFVRVLRTRKVQPLPWQGVAGERRQRGQDHVIDAARTLTATRDEQHRSGGIEAESDTAHRGIARLKLRPHGRARDK